MKQLIIAILIVLGLALTSPLPTLQALDYDRGTYGSCQYGTCSISIASDSTISVDVTPATGGRCTIQSDTIEVETYNSSGYLLTVRDSDTDSALTGSEGSINRSSAAESDPTTLAPNTWGYRVDNLGNFGAGPTSVVSNVPLSDATFAGMPHSGEVADTLAMTTVPAAEPPAQTTVWYGVCADTATLSGTYSTEVTYTAIVNE